ncbi:MAG: M20/M25/M40 family metallo-hydrolase [Anaerolineaceae bacterium]|jgi:carboxypeptidase PM20D1
MLLTPFTFLVVLVALLFFLVAFLLVRTAAFARPFKPVEPVEGLPVDAPVVAEHLSAAIRCETQAAGPAGAPNRQGLLALHRLLESLYPRAHATLKREVINKYSLLYTWEGSQPGLPAVLFMAHQDVVPVESASLPDWTYPPYSGQVAEGFVWGRGALDIKNQIITLFEAVEGLLKASYQPQRTVYLAFGHDEETLSGSGAEATAALLQERMVTLAAVLDEGGTIVDGVLPGVKEPVAMIGTAEKGYLTLELSVQGQPGHTARPPAHTAIGVLAEALSRLEANPMPAHVSAVRPLFKGVGGYAPFFTQMAFANLWLFGGMLKRRLEGDPGTNAAIRTTAAVSMIHGGLRENILPAEARALVNFRLLTGDSIAAICDHARRVIHDERVHLQVIESRAWEASLPSPVDGAVYHCLESATRKVFGNLPAAPILIAGATDARKYVALCENVYRFSPVVTDQADLDRMHGTNERIAVVALEKMVKFYTELIPAWSEMQA